MAQKIANSLFAFGMFCVFVGVLTGIWYGSEVAAENFTWLRIVGTGFMCSFAGCVTEMFAES